ncbi:MAG: hypothetical protein KDB82_10975 [Planctomycetes bacterium]|nr:hypothetical protein [Planctomycetota bacterium]
MDEPPSSSAQRRLDPTTESGVGFQLKLWIQDPEVIAELKQRKGPELEQYALTALRVGVIALRTAGGTVDAEKMKNQGELLLKDLESKLSEHTNTLQSELNEELKRYFNPEDGHFVERVQSLVSQDGKLAELLKQHIQGDDSLLAKELARAVGENSDLMKYLSPNQKDGLIDRIAGVAESKLKEQSERVLREFDLNEEDSALNRLIRDVKRINSEIGEKFDADDEKSVISRLKKALDDTRNQINKHLTLNEDDSALSVLHNSLRKQIEEFTDKQVEFQKAISEQLGIKKVQARTTEGGFGFEHLAAQAVQQRVIALGDEYQSVGELQGLLRRLTGDLLQTMGAESATPGANIVYEVKRDKKYRLKVALEEMKEARRNREADVGVFVMSAQTLREKDDLRAEYPATLARYGNDIIAVWDSEDVSTDVVLDAAISLARALVVRMKQAKSEDETDELHELTQSIADIEKQFSRFEKMSKWCDDIMNTAKDVNGKAYDIQEELRKILKRLKSDVKSLNEGLASISDESTI